MNDYALLFDVHGTGTYWEVDTIGSMETCKAEREIGLRQGQPKRMFRIVVNAGYALGQKVKRGQRMVEMD